jgi:hypothetical protein
MVGRNSPKEIPSLTSHLQNEISESSEKVEVLRQQFSSVFTKTYCQLNGLTETQSKPDEHLNSSPCVSVKTILKQIHKLSTNKAMGRDEIPAIVQQNCYLVIVPCLALYSEGW